MPLAPVGNVVPAHILGNGHNSGKLLCSALDCVILIFNNLLGVTPCKFSTTSACAVPAVKLQNWGSKCTNLSCNGCHGKEKDSRIWLGFLRNLLFFLNFFFVGICFCYSYFHFITFFLFFQEKDHRKRKGVI